VLAFASEPAAQFYAVLFVTRPKPRKLKGRADPLPLINPPPCPLSGVPDCARHLGGCLLARAPDLLLMKSKVCMKPALLFWLGSFFALAPRPHRMTKGYYGKVWNRNKFLPNLGTIEEPESTDSLRALPKVQKNINL
jgi:hypothetical protein